MLVSAGTNGYPCGISERDANRTIVSKPHRPRCRSWPPNSIALTGVDPNRFHSPANSLNNCANFSPSCLHRRGYGYLRRDSDQHLHMIPVDRPGVDHHLLASRNLTQQFAAALLHIVRKHLISITSSSTPSDTCSPTPCGCHACSLPSLQAYPIRRMKARGLPVPYREL